MSTGRVVSASMTRPSAVQRSHGFFTPQLGGTGVLGDVAGRTEPSGVPRFRDSKVASAEQLHHPAVEPSQPVHLAQTSHAVEDRPSWHLCC
jgi:hypothetical protein